MWRISDDHWDVWSHPTKPGEPEFPMGTVQAFSRLVPWRGYVGPGSWPDEDMLPVGYLGPHPGWGEARQSRFTEDEARSEFTLWAITRSPLILGANLTKLDDFTRSLITNKAVLQMNQRVVTTHPVITLPPAWRKVRVWIASEAKSSDPARYLAISNLDDQPIQIRSSLEDLSPELLGAKLRDLWTGIEPTASGEVNVTLAPHASVLYLAQGKLPAK
jgi:hypothetical protein